MACHHTEKNPENIPRQILVKAEYTCLDCSKIFQIGNHLYKNEVLCPPIFGGKGIIYRNPFEFIDSNVCFGFYFWNFIFSNTRKYHSLGVFHWKYHSFRASKTSSTGCSGVERAVPGAAFWVPGRERPAFDG